MIWALLASFAWGGDGYLAGGVAIYPSRGLQLASGMPSWRLGYAGGKWVGWGSVDYASFDLPDADQSGWAVVPHLGVRRDLVAREPKSAVPYLGLATYTRLGATRENGDNTFTEDVGKLKFNLGGTVSFGLDAVITDHLSIGGELGLDAYDARYEDPSAIVNGVLVLGTAAACFVNVWL